MNPQKKHPITIPQVEIVFKHWHVKFLMELMSTKPLDLVEFHHYFIRDLFQFYASCFAYLSLEEFFQKYFFGVISKVTEKASNIELILIILKFLMKDNTISELDVLLATSYLMYLKFGLIPSRCMKNPEL